MDTFSAAMTYVMLSQVCALSQIFILNEFDESKMYPNMNALEELDRLDKISQNNNPTRWERKDSKALKVSSLNCRSLKKHYEDILYDSLLLKSDIICIQETWLDNDEETEDLKIPNYELHLNSKGKGKGIAAYYKKEKFTPSTRIKNDNLQISKFSSSVLDVIVLYRSQSASHLEVTNNIDTTLDPRKNQLIIGDFNFCCINDSSNATCEYLKRQNFKQLVHEPTHIGGHLLDQAYFRKIGEAVECSLEVHSKYFTDHKGLAIIVKKGNTFGY